jgi:hypothetical protein
MDLLNKEPDARAAANPLFLIIEEYALIAGN